MDPQRWQEIDELLDRALARPTGERPAFLEAACNGDPTLQREVELLLELEETRDFLDQPAFSVHDDDPDLGRRIGRYEILHLLGRGGMGAVYLASRRDDYTQRVALKLIKRGMDSDEIVRRFENERQILADLDHPNIARLLDGGTTDSGRPYLVMEYVEGTPIDLYCDSRRLPTRDRLRLFLEVCSAVQLAHQHLVVHRDLKPVNILVTSEGGVPKLLDFGVAKLLDPGPARALATVQGRRPMTVQFASPEQVRGETVNTASDIYSLGVLLYQLLTGHHPHDLESRDTSDEEVFRRICEQEPRRPSTVILGSRTLRRAGGTAVHITPESVSRVRDGDPRKLRRRLAGDLDAILLKALRKEPRRRYGSAGQLAEDVRRYLGGRPVAARPDTLAYRAGKLVRRNPWGVAVLMVVLVSGLTSTLLWQRAYQESQRLTRNQTLLKEIILQFDPDAAEGMLAIDVLTQIETRISESLGDEPALQAELLDHMGMLYRKVGEHEKARRVMEESLEITRTRLPDDSAGLAKRISNLGVLFFDAGDCGQAESRFREALAIRDRLGQEDFATVKNMNNLAACLMYRGRFEEAEALLLQGLEIRTAHYGPDHIYVASSLRSLGVLYYESGDYDKALPRLKRALEIRERSFGPRDTRVAAVHDRLASVLAARGEHAAAEAHFHEALSIKIGELGDRHLAVAQTRLLLADLFLEQDEPRIARLLIERALSRYYEEKNPGSWEIAVGESLLGAYLVRTAQLELAEPCLSESYEVLRKARGEDSSATRKASERLLDLTRLQLLEGKP